MLDIVILIFIGIGLIRGLFIGFIRQAASLAGMLLAFFFAARFGGPVGAWLEGLLGLPTWMATLAGFLVVFVLLELIVYFVARALERALGVLQMGFLNRLAGGILGGLTAAVVAGILLLVGAFMQIPSEETRMGSVLYEPLIHLPAAAWRMVGDNVPRVREMLDRLPDPASDETQPPTAPAGR